MRRFEPPFGGTERGWMGASKGRAWVGNRASGWGCAFRLTCVRRRAIGSGMHDVASVSYPLREVMGLRFSVDAGSKACDRERHARCR